MTEAAMKQQTLIKLSAEQIAKDKIRLADLAIEYIKLEEEKKAADEDFSGRLKVLWEEIRAIKQAMEE